MYLIEFNFVHILFYSLDFIISYGHLSIPIEIIINYDTQIFCSFDNLYTFNCARVNVVLRFFTTALPWNVKYKTFILIEFHLILLTPILNKVNCFDKLISVFNHDSQIISICIYLNSSYFGKFIKQVINKYIE